MISKIRMSRLDRPCDAIDLVAATVDAFVGIVEHAIFGEYLVDGRAPAHGVVFTEDVAKISDQQGRYAVGHKGHLASIVNFCAELLSRGGALAKNSRDGEILRRLEFAV